MDFSWTTTLKYLGLVFSIGTAFVGSWFLEFTTTDKETSRKRFTVWGRRGIFFATLAFVCTLAASLWGDYEAISKQKRAAEQLTQAEALATAERKSAAKYREKSEKTMADIQTLLKTISSANMSPEDKETVRQAVVSLFGIQDYKIHYPDLYDRIVNAKSLDAVASATVEGFNRAVDGRIAGDAKCSKIPRAGAEKLSGFPGESFKIDNSSFISYMIEPTGVQIEFTDANDLNSIDGTSYTLVYADGTESEFVCAPRSLRMSCSGETSNPDVRAVYEQMRTKAISSVRTKKKLYGIPNATSQRMLNTFSCIAP